MSCVPEPEPFEQHADAFAPFRDAVEPAVELEVLERGQLAVDERVMRDVAEAPAVERDLELTGGRDREPCAKAKERRLPGSVRAR